MVLISVGVVVFASETAVATVRGGFTTTGEAVVLRGGAKGGAGADGRC